MQKTFYIHQGTITKSDSQYTFYSKSLRFDKIFYYNEY